MKKIEYMAPEMEVVEIKMESALLTISDGSEPGYGGEGDPEENAPD